MVDILDSYDDPPSFGYRLKQFAKERGIELTIALVGLLVGIATVLVSYKVGKHQEILQASRMTDSYFNGIVELFAKSAEENQRINLLMIARTEAIIEDLSLLNKPDKIANVVVFISNLKPQLFHEEITPESHRQKFIDLSHLNISNTYLHNLELPKANLSSSNLSNCDLSSTNFSEAKLERTNFKDANLAQVNFRGADLTGANLEDADITDAQFEGAILDKAIWPNGIRCKKGSVGTCNFT